MKGEKTMARFHADDMDKYGGQGGTGYFSLKNDRDIATVRFLYNTPDDVEGYAVHEVEIDGKKRYVNCLREYNQPIDDCPFCRARKYQVAKLFIPLYNEDEGKVQVWERGKKFFSKLSSVLSRCDADPICSQTFEIERNGKAGDTQTTYEIYQTREKPDDAKLEDFDEPVIMGRLILDKSADDMEFYLENGYFPPEDEAPTRRSSRREEREEEEMPRRRTGRRTPSDTF
jgi:hypothetical protein